MPIPSSLDDLSPVEALNSPQGGDQVGGNIDNYFRAHALIMKRDLAPALTAVGTVVVPTGNISATDTQAALAELDAGQTAADEALTAHKSSSDHDDRYYQKSQIDTALAGKQAAGNYARSYDGSNVAFSVSGTNVHFLNSAGSYAGQLLTTVNFDPNTKAAANATVQRSTGVIETGGINISRNEAPYIADLPAPYLMTGIRFERPGVELLLYARGCAYRNQ